MDTQEDTEQIGVENGSSIRKGQPCGTTIKPLPKKVGNGRKIETATTRQHLKPRANYTCYQYSAHGTQGHTDSGSGRCSPRPPSQVWGERILRTQSLHWISHKEYRSANFVWSRRADRKIPTPKTTRLPQEQSAPTLVLLYLTPRICRLWMKGAKTSNPQNLVAHRTSPRTTPTLRTDCIASEGEDYGTVTPTPKLCP